MFDSKYKEALENMKLTDDFKAALAKKMKNVKPIPRARLVLVSIAAVLVLTTSVGLAANVASNGKLFRTLFGGQDPQTTDVSSDIPETTEATDVTESTEETTETKETTETTEATTTETTEATETTKETTEATTTTAPPETTTVPPETTAPPTTTVPPETTAPSTRVAPAVNAAPGDNNVTVSWARIDSPDLVGYKVVASISDSTPQYDENGYYAWITDRNTTSCTITNGDGYNGGDVGCFTGGQAYYFSVTAVYGEEWQKIAGNAILVTMPGAAAPTPDPNQHVAPVVNAVAQADGVLVTWNRIDASDLDGYKVVYSATNSSPKYPDDGYYAWITDRNTTSCLVSSKDVPAGDYWFSVTALYNGHEVKVAGNAVKATMPGAAAPTPTPIPSERVAPVVSAAPGDNNVTVSWNRIDSPDLVGYKVVASISDSTPKYDENGYYAWIKDRNTTSCTITNGDGYNGGDVGCFSGGQAYYFSVTAIYGDEWQKIAGNAVQVTMPGKAAPNPTNPAVTITVTPAEGGVNVSWTRTTDDTQFVYYKVVASISNPNPKYSEDGYYTYFEDPNCTSCFIANNAVYNNGDFGGKFASGQAYYFSITACYQNARAVGNAVQVIMP